MMLIFCRFDHKFHYINGRMEIWKTLPIEYLETKFESTLEYCKAIILTFEVFEVNENEKNDKEKKDLQNSQSNFLIILLD